MTTWMLYGGPQHGDTGEGEHPDGYEVFSSGAALAPVYGLAPRRFDEVLRWHEDEAYIRDGRALVERFKSGELRVDPSIDGSAAIESSGVPIAVEVLTAGIGFIQDQPTSEEADEFRRSVDAYREHGLI